MQVIHEETRFTPDDLHLFNEGKHFRLYDKLGAHPGRVDGAEGAHFAVWAPNADQVSVLGDFNGWSPGEIHLHQRQHSGIWEGFVPGVTGGSCYKYHVASRHGNYRVDKADPVAFAAEQPPNTGSRVWDLHYEWSDEQWMTSRGGKNGHDQPFSIYEMHLGSWRRDGSRPLSYRELAETLPRYLADLGFTHVEFLPVMEHPFYGSWGYQVTGFFAPTSRYGDPQDLMYLIDCLHQARIGVILDWVPSHFPTDEHGLGYFDGTHLYEHSDPRQGIHRDWNTFVFNYGRNEVRSYLISNALFWLDKYHIDGLRVDAVASMLYLDYSRKEGEWIPNKYGGRENLDAIEFLRDFNAEVYEQYPDVQTIAEESTAWPMVSKPNYVGGLGFGMKWDMGWMHDMLEYMSKEPLFRKYHHDKLRFRGLYMFHENFVLSLSHDEVVYGKASLLGKMPGDEWQKFANLRCLYGYMFGQPGKKMLFMGGEFGQWREWVHDEVLEWGLLDYPRHRGVQRWLRSLNGVYREEPALHSTDFVPEGFEWVDCHDAEQSVISFVRRGGEPERNILVVCNFTPVPRYNYRVGVPRPGFWREILNSDGEEFGGSGQGNLGGVETVPVPCHGRYHSLTITLPPLAVLFFRHEDGTKPM